MLPERVINASRLLKEYDCLPSDSELRDRFSGFCSWISAVASVPDSPAARSLSLGDLDDRFDVVVSHNQPEIGAKWKRLGHNAQELIERLSGGRARILDGGIRIENCHDGQVIDAVARNPKVFLNEEGEMERLRPTEQITGLLISSFYSEKSLDLNHCAVIIPDQEELNRNTRKFVKKLRRQKELNFHLIIDSSATMYPEFPGLNILTGEQIASEFTEPSPAGDAPTAILEFVACRF